MYTWDDGKAMVISFLYIHFHLYNIIYYINMYTCIYVYINFFFRYVKANLTNDTILKISLPKKGPLMILLNFFVLCQPVSVKVAGKKNKVEQKPTPHSALEELQVMMAIVRKIEEQSNVEQQFYIFEALFGGCNGTIKVCVYNTYIFIYVQCQICVFACVGLSGVCLTTSPF